MSRRGGRLVGRSGSKLGVGSPAKARVVASGRPQKGDDVSHVQRGKAHHRANRERASEPPADTDAARLELGQQTRPIFLNPRNNPM
jgi:hypothetical protein